MSKHFRYSLRAALILMMAISIYLAWRLSNPEAGAIDRILESGGKAYFGYQEPYVGAITRTSGYRMPDYVYFWQYDIVAANIELMPNRTFPELLFGDSQSRKVHAVELRLDRCTPDIIDQLQYLSHLELVMIQMPAMALHKDSDEVRQLIRIEEQFGDRVRTTVDLAR